MFFTKFPHPANFTFGASDVELTVENYANGIARVRATGRWPEGRLGLLPLNTPATSDKATVKVEGNQISVAGRFVGDLGVMEGQSMWRFDAPEGSRYYGQGEKLLGEIELSGRRTRFWNTDVWGDFPPEQWGDSPVDPPYYSAPYLAIRTPQGWVGLLLDNSYPAFIETPGKDDSRVFVEWQRTLSKVILGNDGGEPNLIVIVDDTLAGLTQKLQTLVGVTPTPPLWSLGYHQSRWGYGGREDLLNLDAAFTKNEIPCDGLWMDLDYMDGYRIFTVSEEAFPGGPAKTVADLAKSGRRIVPIIDPGFKREAGYAAYDDGVKENVFCRNPEGGEYVGLVWPGETVFPDFTLPVVRDWWAGYAKAFLNQGFGGCWVDMNDPSTGPVDPEGMLFQNGKLPHAAYRNEYALGMQMATVQGFLQARPDERPFVLSRSGSPGTSRYAAVWSGDNISNYFYLKMSIPTTIGMSISGQPFTGPDLFGFGGDVTDALAVDWVKAGFLFPFFRNHCNRGQRPQAPFELGPAAHRTVRRYIRLRYKLLPYLYSLFAAQEEAGDPILRPVMYHFDDEDVRETGDQFMVGPWIMQAPFLEEKAKTRTMILPGTDPWYDSVDGVWVSPGTETLRKDRNSTPLWFRAGAIVPMRPGTPLDNKTDLRKISLHIFCPPDWSGETSFRYVADDGLSFAYRRGERSAIDATLVSAEGHVILNLDRKQAGYGEIEVTVVVHGDPRSVRLGSSDVPGKPSKVTLAGYPLRVQVLESKA